MPCGIVAFSTIKNVSTYDYLIAFNYYTYILLLLIARRSTPAKDRLTRFIQQINCFGDLNYIQCK